MKKLINIINNRILQSHTYKNSSFNSNSSSQPITKLHNKESRFITFPYRRAKLQKTISIANFQLQNKDPSQFRLATSNFQGSQFIIKKNANSQESRKNSLKIEEFQNYRINENQNENQEVQLPQEVEQLFQKTLQEINKLVYEIFIQKKTKNQTLAFQKNRSLFTILFFSFFISLLSYLLFQSAILSVLQKQSKQINLKYSPYVFLVVCSLICIGLVFNVFCSLNSSYTYFNYDYEVIKFVSQLLKEKNQNCFRQKGYKMSCDLQLTWILLRPIQNNVFEHQHQVQ